MVNVPSLMSFSFFVTQQSFAVVPPVTSGAVSEGSTVQESKSGLGGRERRSSSQTVSLSNEAVNKKFKSECSSIDSEAEEQAVPSKIHEAKAQMEAHARELSALTRGAHLHTVGVLLHDDKVSYWYIDASGVVRTTPESTLSIVLDFEKVAAIHVALSCCGTERHGLFPANVIRPPANNSNPASLPSASLAGHTIDLTESENEKPFKVTLGRRLFNQSSLFGRRTMVYLAESTSADTDGTWGIFGWHTKAFPHYLPLCALTQRSAERGAHIVRKCHMTVLLIFLSTLAVFNSTFKLALIRCKSHCR